MSNESSMKFNTALLFFIGCIVLFRKTITPFNHWLPKLLLGGSSIGIALISLISHYWEAFFDVDNLFMVDTITELFPGRMSPATSVSFILFFLGSVLTEARLPRLRRTGVIMIDLTVGISTIALIGFLFGINAEEKLFFFTSMSAPTAFCFISLSIGIILSEKNHSIFNLLCRPLQGSLVFRRLLPTIIVVPTITGVAAIGLANNGYLSHDFSHVFFTTIMMLIVGFILLKVSRKINKIDIKNF